MTTKKEVIKALKISDINNLLEEITIGTKKRNKTVPITLRGKPIVFQTPFLEVLNNLRSTIYPFIYQLDTLFKGDSKQRIYQWYQFIENLETHISNQLINIGSKWFTQNNVVIKSLIRELDAEKGIFFVKWPIDLNTNIFVDENRKPFDYTTLKEKDLIKLIVEIRDLWIQENQCGLTVVVRKILVKPYIEKIKIESEYIFNEEDSDNFTEEDDKENNIISLLATEQKTRPSNKLNEMQQNQVQQHFLQQNQNSNQEIRNVSQFNPIINSNKEIDDISKQISNESSNKNVNQQKDLVYNRQNRLLNESKSMISNRNTNNNYKNKGKQEHYNKRFDKENVNSNHKKRNLSFKEVFSDISDEGSDWEKELHSQNNNIIDKLVQEYSPSSEEMAEINEEDLDMD